jgi:two-component sensor histidine kinase
MAAEGHENQTHAFPVQSVGEEVPRARRETVTVLTRWGIDAELRYTAGLIVTELVTNVVRHAALLSATATVTLAVETGGLLLEVADAHPFKPAPLPAPYAGGGRGLVVVAGLAGEAGGGYEVFADSDGKRIVVRLPIAPEPASAQEQVPAGVTG